MSATEESIAKKTAPKKYRFKVLFGHHAHNYGTDENPDIVVYRQGDEFDSDTELDRRFNAPGTMKFQRMQKVEDDTEESLDLLEQQLKERRAKLKSKKAKKAETPDDGLDKMTMVQLQELAQDNDIDLGKAKSKEEIIAVIRAQTVEVS